MEGRNTANVDYANPWHAPLVYITCLALKGIGFHGLSLENLEAGNLQVACNSYPALPPPELPEVTVGLPWHLTLAGDLLSSALACFIARSTLNKSHPSVLRQVGIWETNLELASVEY